LGRNFSIVSLEVVIKDPPLTSGYFYINEYLNSNPDVKMVSARSFKPLRKAKAIFNQGETS
jgi:hypothetical protein